MHAVIKISDFDDLAYNPFTAMGDMGGENAILDFYPQLASMRRASPVFEGDIRNAFGLPSDLTLAGIRSVALLGHKAVSEALGDTKRFSNSIYNHNLGKMFGRSVTTMDNPEHLRFRRLFQGAFSPRTTAKWGEEIIPRIINRLIDGFEGEGRAELVSEFTLHFPFHFIHELMGLPDEDREIFHKLAFGQIAIIFDAEHGDDAINKLRNYLIDVVKERRKSPRDDDFMSLIATAEIDGERLPDEVVIAFFRQLMNAGGDTSYHGFSTVLSALLTHPDQLDRVRLDPALAARAIEDGLRWNCPVPMIARTTTELVEIDGVAIHPGDHVAIMLAAANRDETVFEQPDKFNIDRGSRNHAAFGFGPHICIGQHLARLEMQHALTLLLERLPKLRLDDRHPSPVISGFSLRGPKALNVRFD